MLRRCLAALAAQTMLDELEVIVVDDGSRSPDAVASLVDGHSFARVIRKAPSGPAAARNAGAAHARTDVLCFTDDDCEPEPAWAARLFGAIQSGADAAAGKTLSQDPGSALATASELIAEAPASLAVSSGSGLSFAPSNNLACRADVLAAVPFDERYRAAAGEDRDWCDRLTSGGYVLRAAPEAVLRHCAESTLRAFIARQLRYGRGAFWFRRGRDQRRPLESPSFYVALLRRGFRHGFRTGMLVVVAQGATAVGFFLEWAGRGGARRSEPRACAHPADRP
jgi:glycosyltransferase involved in cell wall biosynthesis